MSKVQLILPFCFTLLFQSVAIADGTSGFDSSATVKGIPTIAQKPLTGTNAEQVHTIAEPTTSRCESDQVTIWLLGGVQKQGTRLCLPATGEEASELRNGPVFFTRVLAQAQGVEPQFGQFDQIYLYDLTSSSPTHIKKRLFDYNDMEFQWKGIKRSLERNQKVEIKGGKEYAVFVNTPADNYWMEIMSKAVSWGTTIGGIIGFSALIK